MAYTKKIGKRNITIYENNLKRYLNDIRAHVPDAQVEKELFDKYFSKETTPEEKIQARNEIIKMNQRFILSVAKTYANNDESLTMDLVSVGTLGMAEAFDYYDPSKGYKFCTFAQYYVRRAITHFLGNENMLVRPTNNMRVTPKIKKIEEAFEKKYFRKPTVDEVEKMLEEKYGIILSNKAEIADLEIIRTDDFDTSEDDDVTDIKKMALFNTTTAIQNNYEEQSDVENTKNLIKSAMSCLSERETTVIKMAFGMDDYLKEYKNNEIGEALNLSAERVRQIKDTALAKLKLSMAKRTV